MINRNIKDYIERDIIPKYRNFDGAHNTDHANQVIENSFSIAKKLKNVNEDIIYVTAAYHDLGLSIDRKNHHVESVKIFDADDYIKSFFEPAEIQLIKEAIHDHRASSGIARNIYSEIICDADRDYNFDRIILRCIMYRRDLQGEQLYKEVLIHIRDKYSIGGYLGEFYILKKDPKIQAKFQRFCTDSEFSKKEFNRIYDLYIKQLKQNS